MAQYAETGQAGANGKLSCISHVSEQAVSDNGIK
jgi:hypothetical protein